MVKKTAVILFNLGGPDSQEAVRPFLFNLFHDPAIIRAPRPFRYLIAKLISIRRAPIARAIYANLGGGSPILKNTHAQAQALEQELNSDQQYIHKTFIAMRYWHPFASEAVRDVKNFSPDEIILLPLYPQFSTTTTQSSIEEWRKEADKARLNAPTKTICCYPQEPGFIRAIASSIRSAYEDAKKYGLPRILFSAHGLPEKIVKAGDPYQTQCEMTANALRHELSDIESLDAVLCFQSRVGPLRWIGPSTDDEIRRAGHDKKPVVIAPIAFVSDHSETLVEIDIEYRHLAQQSGVPFFAFVPAVGAAPVFIQGLARLVRAALSHKNHCLSAAAARICPSQSTPCLFGNP